MYLRTIKNHLSFKGHPLIQDRHKIHTYPAMLHPLLVDDLIKTYARSNDTIFDPFCGSGVTLLQASKNHHHSIGCDINPLALLISKVKNTHYDTKVLREEFKHIQNQIDTITDNDIPQITNIDYWYKPNVIKDLGRIRYILKTNKYTYQDFFTVCFAFLCRNQSLNKNGEFKRYRMHQNQIDQFQGNPVNKLIDHIQTMIDTFEHTEQPTQKPFILAHNVETPIDKKITYDFVITSPPYGDSRTTVAYGQYCSFGLDWIRDLNPFGNANIKIDTEGLGKIGTIDPIIYSNPFLSDTVQNIQTKDTKRAQDVLYFFNGYYKALKTIVSGLNPKGRIAFVVGNRTVKEQKIPTDQITAWFLDKMGLTFNSILVRDISNKIMPHYNSPSNIKGRTKQTMHQEYIVLFTYEGHAC